MNLDWNHELIAKIAKPLGLAILYNRPDYQPGYQALVRCRHDKPHFGDNDIQLDRLDLVVSSRYCLLLDSVWFVFSYESGWALCNGQLLNNHLR